MLQFGPEHHHRAYLSAQQEQDLSAYAQWMAERGWPLTTGLLQGLARDVVHTQNPTAQSFPSIKWAQRFSSKYGFSQRIVKQTKSRGGSIYKETLCEFFDMLRSLINDNNVDAENIINMDETGWGRKQQFEHSKFMVKRGTKHPYTKMAFCVDHITSVHSGTASGELLPTMLIFKQSMPCWVDVESLPDGWVYSVSDSGFMNKSLFYQWVLLILVPFAVRKRSKIICIIDNASCHLCTRAIDLCRQHNIELMALPANATWILQPFDQVFHI